jgi:hypothetical protein
MPTIFTTLKVILIGLKINSMVFVTQCDVAGILSACKSVLGSVADPVFFFADQDPTFQPDADPVPNPTVFTSSILSNL